MSIKDRLASYGDFLDVGIFHHGFAPHMRDYDVVFEALWGEKKWGDKKGTYRLRFTHCPEVSTVTAVSDAAWKESWSECFIDEARWMDAGEPEGFCWWARWSMAYPGLSYVEKSRRAKHWSKRLGEPMHEVLMETEAFHLRIVFNDFSVTKLNDEVHVLDKVVFPLQPPGEPDPG